MNFDRRQLLTAGLVLGASQALPDPGMAQRPRLVAAALTGSWEVAFREVLVPAFRKSNDADVALDPIISAEQLSKVTASKAHPPLDVMILDPGPSITAVAQGLVDPYPVAKSQYYPDIHPDAKTPMGVAPFFQLVGLAYNPERIKTPPTSWKDLWKAEYKGRVGLTHMLSTLGTAFMVEVARMHGGSEADIDSAFEALKELKPNIGAIAANPSQLATLFQQGQIDIAPAIFNEIVLLKARDVPVDFALPKERGIGYTSTFHLVKNSANPELAFKYIETALSPEVQTKLMEQPYLIIPTNTKVKTSGEIARTVGRDAAEMESRLVFENWNKINEHRAAWIERFNREVKS